MLILFHNCWSFWYGGMISSFQHLTFCLKHYCWWTIFGSHGIKWSSMVWNGICRMWLTKFWHVFTSIYRCHVFCLVLRLGDKGKHVWSLLLSQAVVSFCNNFLRCFIDGSFNPIKKNGMELCASEFSRFSFFYGLGRVVNQRKKPNLKEL